MPETPLSVTGRSDQFEQQRQELDQLRARAQTATPAVRTGAEAPRPPDNQGQDRQDRSPVRAAQFPAPLPMNRDQPQRRNMPAPAPKRDAPATDRPAPATYIPPLPRRKSRRSHGVLISFVLCVLLPIALSIFYYNKIASPQFDSEFRFSVKEMQSPSAPAGGAAASSMLQMLGSSTSNSSDNYLVVDFLRSSEAVEELQNRTKIMSMYSRPDIDWLSRFDSTKSIDQFVPYWQHQISANYDQVTGLAIVQVRAFSAQDAFQIATTLVKLSEELINRIATRQQNDAVKFAQQELEKQQNRLRDIRQRLTEFRNRTGVIDPASSVVASNSTLAQTVRAGLAQLETNLAILMQQHLNPTAPAVVGLQSQIKAQKAQLAQLESNVGRSIDGKTLSTLVGEYEKLDLERQFAQTSLTGAMAILDQARAQAASQQLYITPYVKPRIASAAAYPRTGVSVMMFGFLAFICWTIGLLIFRAIREHYV